MTNSAPPDQGVPTPPSTEIERVLREHQWIATTSGGETRCSCDRKWRGHGEYRSHVAEALAAIAQKAVAQAWDEARERALEDVAFHRTTSNPHRSTTRFLDLLEGTKQPRDVQAVIDQLRTEQSITETGAPRLTLPAQLAAATIKECAACRGKHWCPRCSDRRDALARAIETLVATVSELVASPPPPEGMGA